MSALGLADYGSSDEEDVAIAPPRPSKVSAEEINSSKDGWLLMTWSTKTNEEQVKPVVNQDKGVLSESNHTSMYIY